MLKISRAKVEAHFLKKPAVVTNKCLGQDALGECPKITENLSKCTVVRELLCAQICLFFIILRIFLYL